MNKLICIAMFFYSSCSTGNLTVITDLPTSLGEVSAIEKTSKSDLLWVIEDSGNKNHIYGLNKKGQIVKDLKLANAKNDDWEDLTSDAQGNIYIGDFGDNNRNRKKYTILKVEPPENASVSINSEKIRFTLPKDEKPQDFEAFFLLNDFFYLFSKNDKRCKVFKVPNMVGSHVAIFMAELNLKGKHNAITSADYLDGTIVLLNHEKIWEITNFENDDFLNGNISDLPFNHTSQKEGVCFKDKNTLIITDEKNKYTGGNVYAFRLN